MKTTILHKFLIALLMITSVSSCYSLQENTVKKNTYGKANFVFVDFYGDNIKLVFNDKVIVNEKITMKISEVGLSTGGGIKPIKFGENSVTLYKDNKIIYQDTIIVPKDTKTIYILPNKPYIDMNNSEILLLD